MISFFLFFAIARQLLSRQHNWMMALALGLLGLTFVGLIVTREYGVSVWATDLWFSPSENLLRIRDAGFASNIYPIHADARALPFAVDFFDAILSIDAFPYFGTDDHYLSYLARFVKPSGVIATAGAGFINEIESDVPDHLSAWFRAEPALWCMHSFRRAMQRNRYFGLHKHLEFRSERDRL